MKNVNVVTYSFVMKNKRGKVLESSRNKPTSYVETHGQTLQAVENALKSKLKGEMAKLHLRPSEAYGEYNDSLVLELSNDKFKKKPRLDDKIRAKSPSGKLTEMRVVDFTDEKVILDGNHPFSGEEIFMDIEVIDKRPASLKEIETGEIRRFDVI